MLKMRIKGIGLVTVTKLPKYIPKRIKISGHWFNVDKDNFKLFWATKYVTKAQRKSMIKKWGMK